MQNRGPQASISEPSKAEPRSRIGIESRLVELLSEMIGIDAREIDRQKNVISYGLDSMDAVVISGEMCEWLEIDDIDLTVMWEFPTLEALSGYLEGLANSHHQTSEPSEAR